MTIFLSCYIVKSCNSDILTFFHIISYNGFVSLFKDICSFSFSSICICCAFTLFIKYLAPKISLFLGGITLMCIYSLVFSPRFFSDNLSLFILSPIFFLHQKQLSQFLFYHLWYCILLQSFSIYLIHINYFGITPSIFILTATTTITLLLLSKKTIYPSKTTLLSIYPLSLLGYCQQLINTATVNFEFIFSILILQITLLALLNKKTIINLSCSLFLCIIYLTLWKFNSFIISLNAFIIVSSMIEVFFFSKYPPPSHKHASLLPMQPSLPSLHFYNEHMRY